jgi:Cdc6-like AAA superfamily ATPase
MTNPILQQFGDHKLKDNPYVYGNPIHEETTFFGRKDELEQIIQAVTKPRKQDVLIIGERRTGKTSLLYQLEKRLDRPFIPVYVALNKSKPRTEDVLALILRSIISRLVQLELLDNEWKTMRFSYPDFEDNIKDIIEAARKKLDDVQIVLLLDEADFLLQIDSLHSIILNIFRKRPQVDERVQNILRAVLQSRIGSRLSAVVSSTNDLLTYSSQSGSPFFNQFRFIRLKLLSPQEIETLIRTPASMLGYTYAPGTVEHITNLSGGHPYYCQALCYEAFENALRAKRIIIGEPDVALAEKKITDDLYSAYLSSFWKRADRAERAYLAQLAHDRPLENTPKLHFQRLLDWQIITEVQGKYVFTAELLKKWTLMAS